ncbi:MAG: hypothetical protein ACREIW_01790 [Chthoniobacterales bacterium]
MLRLLGRLLLVIALSLAVGLHWVVLQSVAWTAMLVKYAKRQSLQVAVCQTFDGDHPCSLCHVVNKGKNCQGKTDVQSPSPKLDMICSARSFWLLVPFLRIDYRTADIFAYQTGKSPPNPPPRFVLG